MMLSNPTAHLLWALLAVNIIKGLALFLIAYVITRLAKRISPAHKHLIWFTVIISFVVLPVLWFFLPAFQNSVQVAPGMSEAWRLTSAPFISRDLYMDNILKVYQFYVFPRETKTTIITNALIILGGVWFAGVLFYLSRYIAAQTILKGVRSSAVEAAAFNPLLAVLSKKVKLKKRVVVLSSSQCGIPFTYGLRRPYIILPESSMDWSEERLNSILLHELAHIKRNDFLYKTITSIICSLFWFLPIIWIAHSFMLREEEKSCDKYVLEAGFSRSEYASDIVDVIQSSKGYLLLPSAFSGIGHRGRLKERIRNILTIQPRTSEVFKRIGRLSVIAFFGILPLLGMTYTTKPYVPAPDELLYGTWKSEKCEKYGTIVDYAHQGVSLRYLRDGSDPLLEDRYLITDKWMDSDGNTCYKLKIRQSFYPYNESTIVKKWFKIMRIRPDGRVMETVCAETGYPQEFSTVGGGSYWVYERQ